MQRTLTYTLALALVLGLGAGCQSSDVSRTLGARCDLASECDERCLVGDPGDWPGGLCTISCDDDGDCPGDARCVADEGGVCLFECQDAGDCEFLGVGWGCAQRAGRPDGEVMVCRGQ